MTKQCIAHILYGPQLSGTFNLEWDGKGDKPNKDGYPGINKRSGFTVFYEGKRRRVRITCISNVAWLFIKHNGKTICFN